MSGASSASASGRAPAPLSASASAAMSMGLPGERASAARHTGMAASALPLWIAMAAKTRQDATDSGAHSTAVFAHTSASSRRCCAASATARFAHAGAKPGCRATASRNGDSARAGSPAASAAQPRLRSAAPSPGDASSMPANACSAAGQSRRAMCARPSTNQDPRAWVARDPSPRAARARRDRRVVGAPLREFQLRDAEERYRMTGIGGEHLVVERSRLRGLPDAMCADAIASTSSADRAMAVPAVTLSAASARTMRQLREPCTQTLLYHPEDTHRTRAHVRATSGEDLRRIAFARNIRTGRPADVPCCSHSVEQRLVLMHDASELARQLHNEAVALARAVATARLATDCAPRSEPPASQKSIREH